jgi:hypothetical protein
VRCRSHLAITSTHAAASCCDEAGTAVGCASSAAESAVGTGTDESLSAAAEVPSASTVSPDASARLARALTALVTLPYCVDLPSHFPVNERVTSCDGMSDITSTH